MSRNQARYHARQAALVTPSSEPHNEPDPACSAAGWLVADEFAQENTQLATCGAAHWGQRARPDSSIPFSAHGRRVGHVATTSPVCLVAGAGRLLDRACRGDYQMACDGQSRRRGTQFPPGGALLFLRLIRHALLTFHRRRRRSPRGSCVAHWKKQGWRVARKFSREDARFCCARAARGPRDCARAQRALAANSPCIRNYRHRNCPVARDSCAHGVVVSRKESFRPHAPPNCASAPCGPLDAPATAICCCRVVSGALRSGQFHLADGAGRRWQRTSIAVSRVALCVAAGEAFRRHSYHARRDWHTRSSFGRLAGSLWSSSGRDGRGWVSLGIGGHRGRLARRSYGIPARTLFDQGRLAGRHARNYTRNFIAPAALELPDARILLQTSAFRALQPALKK